MIPSNPFDGLTVPSQEPTTTCIVTISQAPRGRGSMKAPSVAPFPPPARSWASRPSAAGFTSLAAGAASVRLPPPPARWPFNLSVSVSESLNLSIRVTAGFARRSAWRRGGSQELRRSELGRAAARTWELGESNGRRFWPGRQGTTTISTSLTRRRWSGRTSAATQTARRRRRRGTRSGSPPTAALAAGGCSSLEAGVWTETVSPDDDGGEWGVSNGKEG
jgi:hypothetical protein